MDAIKIVGPKLSLVWTAINRNCEGFNLAVFKLKLDLQYMIEQNVIQKSCNVITKMELMLSFLELGLAICLLVIYAQSPDKLLESSQTLSVTAQKTVTSNSKRRSQRCLMLMLYTRELHRHTQQYYHDSTYTLKITR